MTVYSHSSVSMLFPNFCQDSKVYQKNLTFDAAKSTNLFVISLIMGAIGQNFHILSCVDSTNNYAMAQVHEGVAKHGDTYFAYEQTAGKGQRNKKWITTAGENIIMSTVLYPAGLLLTDQFGLSIAVALGCHDLLQRYAVEKNTIKWPNDIYWNDRKAGGILIENGIQGNDWQYAIAGIGININQTKFPEEVKNPVSLRQITGRSLDASALARELCNLLETRYVQLISGGKDALFSEYNEILYKRAEPVRLRRNNIVFDATVQGVDKQGRLIAQTGVLEHLQVGEVEWIL